jgi:hypothetical protein
VFVKWSFSRRLGGYVSHTRRGVYRSYECGKSNHMQISILWVAAVIIPCSIVFGVVLGMFAMLVIWFQVAVERAHRARNDLWRSMEADIKNVVASLAYKPAQWL